MILLRRSIQLNEMPGLRMSFRCSACERSGKLPNDGLEQTDPYAQSDAPDRSMRAPLRRACGVVRRSLARIGTMGLARRARADGVFRPASASDCQGPGRSAAAGGAAAERDVGLEDRRRALC